MQIAKEDTATRGKECVTQNGFYINTWNQFIEGKSFEMKEGPCKRGRLFFFFLSRAFPVQTKCLVRMRRGEEAGKGEV